MDYSHIITLFLIFSAHLVILGASSTDHHYDDLFECLIDQYRHSNSEISVIYTPQNSTYASLIQAQNLRPQSLTRPDVIITPYHESEIQAAVYCSKQLGLQIRVRSGGHDYEGLSYISEIPFFIIDMRNFRSINIDTKKKTAWVQVGATLGQVYHTIAQKSKTLAFPAGVCPTVGVGGHFSGGGYGMISRKHGIALDHIIDARLINADGEILDRRTMGEDLFWAIRGGGGNSFGIVLEFKVTLVTVPGTVTVFNVTRTSEQATDLVHRWQYIADKVDDDLEIRVFLSTIKSQTGSKTILASFESLYLGPVRDLLPLMQEKFPELGLVEQDCTEMSWIESTLFFAGMSGQPLDALLNKASQGIYGTPPIYVKGKSDYVSNLISKNGFRSIWRFLHEEAENVRLQFSPYGGALNTISESETPFPHRKGNIFSIHYGLVWTSPNESTHEIESIRRLYSFMARYATKSPRAAYLNYRDLDIGRNNIEGTTSYEQASIWGHKYFKSNFKRLVRVKTKVDPTNFFKNEQSVPPLSSKKKN